MIPLAIGWLPVLHGVAWSILVTLACLGMIYLLDDHRRY